MTNVREKTRALLVLLTITSVSSAAAANFVQGGGPADITIVNLTTGAVTMCPTDAEAIPTGAALPACVNAGALSVEGINGNSKNISIAPASASMGGEVITNLTNGNYLQCNVEVRNGIWSGNCQSGIGFGGIPKAINIIPILQILMLP